MLYHLHYYQLSIIKYEIYKLGKQVFKSLSVTYYKIRKNKSIFPTIVENEKGC